MTATFITSGPVNVNENTGGVVVYDADTTGSSEVTFLLSGADRALFTINSATGVVTLINAADFETDAQYDIKVTAFDAADTTSTTQSIVVDINDVNEAPSNLAYSGMVTDFDETADTSVAIKVGSFSYDDDAMGTETITLTGADASLFSIVGTDIFLNAGATLDFEANPVLDVTIQLKDGSFPTLTKSFSIDVNDIDPALKASQTLTAIDENTNFSFDTVDPAGDVSSVTYGVSTDKDGALFKVDSAGNLSFITPPNFENPLDGDGDNTYVVNVTATDDLKGVAEISQYTITVKDVNDVAPQVTSAATANVNEGVTAAYTITSSGDVDTTGEATVYSISGTDVGLFNVDSSTGAVTFKIAPDHEAPADSGADNVYNITVKASDGTNETTKSVAITVNDLNDNTPVITSAATANVNENQTVAYDVNATDADTVGGPTVYSISGGADQSLFSINSSTGVVSFVAAPNFEAPGDAGGDNVYDIVVMASDGVNSTTQAVAITVDDVNDVAPQVDSAATANVNEGVTAAYTITSSGDVDTTLEPTVYSISGTDAAKFDVDSGTGAVTFKVAPDHEAPADSGGNNIYNIIVKASDDVNFTTKNVAITVDDLNDTAPVFTSSTTKTVNENQTAVMTVTTSDADTVGTIPATFTITGGADMALFDITSGGVLTFKVATDFETKADAGTNGVYEVEVTADDGTNTTIQSIAVTVADVNEAPTGVVVNLSVPNVSESNSSKLLVGTYTVTDDALGTETITLSGADASLLEVSAGNIYIKAGVLLDHETNPALNFTVNAQDLSIGGVVSSSAQVITVDDAVPLLVDDDFASIAENTKAVGNVVDIAGDHSGVVYGISDSDDGALFQVDAAGNLSFIAAPDFENPLDVGADNTYTVTVTADDLNGNLAAHAYTFNVTDVAGGTFTGNGSSNTLNGTGEADTINGLGGNDTLNGLAGNDVINGGSGSDAMNGGTGDDTYFVDNTTGDKAVEALSQGTDTVFSTVNFTLGVNVENLTLQGSNNRNGTGNTLDNVLTGNTGNNVLNGLDGADTLTGGLGRDTMTGGAGNDTFDFNVILDSRVRPNHDIITDFNNGDIIDLSDIAGLTGVAGAGAITANSVSWLLVGGNTIISIETTGNGVADMEIQLNGNKLAILDVGDFLI